MSIFSFSHFLNCTNGTKWLKTSHLVNLAMLTLFTIVTFHSVFVQNWRGKTLALRFLSSLACQWQKTCLFINWRHSSMITIKFAGTIMESTTHYSGFTTEVFGFFYTIDFMRIGFLIVVLKCFNIKINSSRDIITSTILTTLLSPFHVTGLFIYPLKTSENPLNSWCFQGGIERDQWHNIG